MVHDKRREDSVVMNLHDFRGKLIVVARQTNSDEQEQGKLREYGETA